MGTDIFRYVVLSLDGKTAIIEFYSGQCQGLAPYHTKEDENSQQRSSTRTAVDADADHNLDDHEREEDDNDDDEVAAFWVDALSCSSEAFKYVTPLGRQANCPLTKHELFRQPTEKVVVRTSKGRDLTSMEDVKNILQIARDKIIKEEQGDQNQKGQDDDDDDDDDQDGGKSRKKSRKNILETCGMGYNGQNGGYGYICFRALACVKRFIELVDGHKIESSDNADDNADDSDNRVIEAYFKNVRDGPEFISRFDIYPQGTFTSFVEKVHLEEVFYDCLSTNIDPDAWKKVGIKENYYNTKARYKVVMKSEEFLNHLKELEEWDGR
jgi:hypothetical protein